MSDYSAVDNVNAEFDQEDIEKNKGIAAVAYALFLFFLPLVACPDSKFGRFHANQALLNFLTSIALSVGTMIPFIGWMFRLLLAYPAIITILGIVRALNGEAQEIPIIGQYRLIK